VHRDHCTDCNADNRSHTIADDCSNSVAFGFAHRCSVFRANGNTNARSQHCVPNSSAN